MFLAGTDLSVMYYRWDSEFLRHSAVIRLTGRGHHYERLQREEGEGARLILGTQLHRWRDLLPQTHVNSRVLITECPDLVSRHVSKMVIIEVASSCHSAM